jgi:hypothetical protein
MTVLQSKQTCNAKRPSAAAAVRPWAVRLRIPGGLSGSRVRFRGFLRLGGMSGLVTRVSRERRHKMRGRDRN